MQKKINILVPTDFSRASLAGIRFAIQWSQQQNAHLTFVHVMTLLRLTKWTDRQFEDFAVSERKLRQKQLDTLIADVQRRYPLPPDSYSLLLLEGVSADVVLLDYCRRHPGIHLVCMGTRGAGKVSKLFGTNTGNLITHSDIPVIAVPAAYRRKEITRILYATDLSHYQNELKEIVRLARPLHAKISVLHLVQPGETPINTNILQKVWEKEFDYPVTVDFRSADSSISQTADLDRAVTDFNPSLVIMFSDRRRTLFQRIFYPSRAENLAFSTKAPLLVLGKREV